MVSDTFPQPDTSGAPTGKSESSIVIVRAHPYGSSVRITRLAWSHRGCKCYSSSPVSYHRDDFTEEIVAEITRKCIRIVRRTDTITRINEVRYWRADLPHTSSDSVIPASPLFGDRHDTGIPCNHSVHSILLYRGRPTAPQPSHPTCYNLFPILNTAHHCSVAWG